MQRHVKREIDRSLLTRFPACGYSSPYPLGQFPN